MGNIGQDNELFLSLWVLIKSIIIKNYKAKNRGMIVLTAISKHHVFLLLFSASTDSVDLIFGADNTHVSDQPMITRFQALMIFWNRLIRDTGLFIAPEKTSTIISYQFAVG